MGAALGLPEGVLVYAQSDEMIPPAEVRVARAGKCLHVRRIDLLGNAAGIASAPNTMGHAKSFRELMKLASSARLGTDLVVQTPYGDSGRIPYSEVIGRGLGRKQD